MKLIDYLVFNTNFIVVFQLYGGGVGTWQKTGMSHQIHWHIWDAAKVMSQFWCSIIWSTNYVVIKIKKTKIRKKYVYTTGIKYCPINKWFTCTPLYLLLIEIILFQEYYKSLMQQWTLLSYRSRCYYILVVELTIIINQTLLELYYNRSLLLYIT